ncbi:hypothetical protein GPECTOR_33g606 [Gonium pectorale]|uniref:Uncharacterized protein n=1 Tax=Gonium pectorale TaxID=33097 RepID=A0A150GD06_GONPE|nr:hypothetical protein GPECTOR_33g606 [Gonium pectorale]|eukprot:KXZ47724.1 hypothetical protein GPECTOR_33g606 [Gonium pectorale]
MPGGPSAGLITTRDSILGYERSSHGYLLVLVCELSCPHTFVRLKLSELLNALDMLLGPGLSRLLADAPTAAALRHRLSKQQDILQALAGNADGSPDGQQSPPLPTGALEAMLLRRLSEPAAQDPAPAFYGPAASRPQPLLEPAASAFMALRRCGLPHISSHLLDLSPAAPSGIGAILLSDMGPPASTGKGNGRGGSEIAAAARDSEALRAARECVQPPDSQLWPLILDEMRALEGRPSSDTDAASATGGGSSRRICSLDLSGLEPGLTVSAIMLRLGGPTASAAASESGSNAGVPASKQSSKGGGSDGSGGSTSTAATQQRRHCWVGWVVAYLLDEQMSAALFLSPGDPLMKVKLANYKSLPYAVATGDAAAPPRVLAALKVAAAHHERAFPGTAPPLWSEARRLAAGDPPVAVEAEAELEKLEAEVIAAADDPPPLEEMPTLALPAQAEEPQREQQRVTPLTIEDGRGSGDAGGAIRGGSGGGATEFEPTLSGGVPASKAQQPPPLRPLSPSLPLQQQQRSPSFPLARQRRPAPLIISSRDSPAGLVYTRDGASTGVLMGSATIAADWGLGTATSAFGLGTASTTTADVEGFNNNINADGDGQAAGGGAAAAAAGVVSRSSRRSSVSPQGSGSGPVAEQQAPFLKSSSSSSSEAQYGGDRGGVSPSRRRISEPLTPVTQPMTNPGGRRSFPGVADLPPGRQTAPSALLPPAGGKASSFTAPGGTPAGRYTPASSNSSGEYDLGSMDALSGGPGLPASIGSSPDTHLVKSRSGVGRQLSRSQMASREATLSSDDDGDGSMLGSSRGGGAATVSVLAGTLRRRGGGSDGDDEFLAAAASVAAAGAGTSQQAAVPPREATGSPALPAAIPAVAARALGGAAPRFASVPNAPAPPGAMLGTGVAMKPPSSRSAAGAGGKESARTATMAPAAGHHVHAAWYATGVVRKSTPLMVAASAIGAASAGGSAAGSPAADRRHTSPAIAAPAGAGVGAGAGASVGGQTRSVSRLATATASPLGASAAAPGRAGAEGYGDGGARRSVGSSAGSSSSATGSQSSSLSVSADGDAAERGGRLAASEPAARRPAKPRPEPSQGHDDEELPRDGRVLPERLRGAAPMAAFSLPLREAATLVAQAMGGAERGAAATAAAAREHAGWQRAHLRSEEAATAPADDEEAVLRRERGHTGAEAAPQRRGGAERAARRAAPEPAGEGLRSAVVGRSEVREAGQGGGPAVNPGSGGIVASRDVGYIIATAVAAATAAATAPAQALATVLAPPDSTVAPPVAAAVALDQRPEWVEAQSARSAANQVGL